MPHRKSFLPAFLTLAIVLTVAAVAAQAADNPPGYSYARIVRLSYVAGDVQIVRTDKSNRWEPAVMNMPVEQGFAIGTNNGRAEIELEHGSTIWLADNSVLQFTELALSNGGRITRMTLSEGTAAFQAGLSSGDTFEVETPSFRATPAKSAAFRIDLRDNNKNGAVSVFNGKVSVSDSAGAQEVPKGQTLAIKAKGKSAQDALLKNASADDFDHWVSSRSNAKYNGETQAALYTNAPFSYGMADLSAYGAWNYFPGYGLGWQPFGIGAGWAPFMSGQWMFYPTFGWSWISAEPWGWVPYHFGGWNYDPVFGWMWIPGNYGMWTAAPVNWVSVGNQVGWVPRPGSTLHPTAGSTPVVLSSKKLGKEGTNRVYSATSVSARMQTLTAAPGENGKPLAAGRVSTAQAVVPTASNLGTLRAALPANSAAKLSVNNAATSVSSLHAATPNRGFEPINAGMRPAKMPSRPPSRATFTTREMGGFGPAVGSRGAAPTSTTVAPAVAMPAPASTARPSGGAAAGKPH